jgi:hypothetical protein
MRQRGVGPAHALEVVALDVTADGILVGIAPGRRGGRGSERDGGGEGQGGADSHALLRFIVEDHGGNPAGPRQRRTGERRRRAAERQAKRALRRAA